MMRKKIKNEFENNHNSVWPTKYSEIMEELDKRKADAARIGRKMLSDDEWATSQISANKCTSYVSVISEAKSAVNRLNR